MLQEYHLFWLDYLIVFLLLRSIVTVALDYSQLLLQQMKLLKVISMLLSVLVLKV
ncbi:Uncharacterised protein [Pseudomonas aeruginosa]|nr:Uncharacterised protein [Pseudomonas aeruginosa]